MILNKSLLLKCLGGVAACFGTAGVGILGSQSGLWNNQSPREEPETTPAEITTTELGTLIAKVGLTTCTSTDSRSNECAIGADGLKVKQDDNKEESKKKTSTSTGKIKVLSEATYNQGFKFVIEEGDITFESGGTITKLEQFETYEIKEEGADSEKKWYFSRKDKAGKKIKELLNLPSTCTLDNDCSEKEISTNELKVINFEGKTQNQEITVSGSAILTITKLTTPEEDFPFDYKFSFKGRDGEVTLNINGNTITLKQNEGTEFKIKRDSTNNTITLEEAWSLNRLLEKVGLQCNGSNSSECTISNGGLKVKQEGESGEEGKTKDTNNGASTGKIKVSKESTATTYNKGFKFVIEEGDIKLTGGTGSTITKLEEFETYEIKEESGKWYFSRKDKADKKIKELLGLPSDCSLPETSSSSETTCSIDTNNISTIKFDGESSTPSITGTATLTITKLSTTDTEFPFDYKFGFKGKDSNATLTINSNPITLKTNEDTEFKIKKGTSGNSLTLAQVWTLETLAKKVNLTCTNDNTCTQISGQTTNIKHENELDGKTLTTSSSGKIKVYTGTEATDYNKGFKFVIEGADVSTSDNTTKLEEFETYEIKEESNKWYFYRKDKAEKGIKKALGIDGINDCNFPTGGSNTSTCCDLDAEKLKKIKFEEKGENGEVTVANGNTSPSLKISITSEQEKTQFPLGYKFTLISDKEITLNTEDSKSIKANTNTEFKIKATSSSSGSARTLSLEKAWTAKSLGQKVGLNCDEPADNGDKKCSFTNESNINVKNDDNSKIDGAKLKNSSDSSDKKLKYEEDQGGYNQGIKFTVEGDAAIELSKDEDSTASLSIENSSNSYEIKEDTTENKWYLTKKTDGGLAS